MEPVPKISSIPLESIHCQLGARLAPFAGYLMPVQYDGIIAEHAHTRQSAGLFDVSHMGTILISGPDIEDHLERLMPTDLKELGLNQTKYTFLMNDKGGIEDDLLITRIAEGFQLVVNAGQKMHDLHYLRHHLPPTSSLEPLFDDVLLALQGPRSAHVMERLCAPAHRLPFMGFGYFAWRHATLAISRSGYTGEDGFEIRVPAPYGEELFNWLMAQEEVKPCGLGARDTLRLEAGLCLYGHELTSQTTPVQANLSWAIGKRRRQSGGFLGALKILSELQESPTMKRVGLTLTGRAIAREGSTIHKEDGQQIGYVTSGTHSPTLNCAIAMGYVESLYESSPMTINVRGTMHPATLTKLPFVSHNYYRG